MKQRSKSVTVGAIAQRAHVDEGTPYLYRNAKGDLFLKIIARSLTDVPHNLVARACTKPALAVAERLCVAFARARLECPSVRALRVMGAGMLGALFGGPHVYVITAESGPFMILRRLISLW